MRRGHTWSEGGRGREVFTCYEACPRQNRAASAGAGILRLFASLRSVAPPFPFRQIGQSLPGVRQLFAKLIQGLPEIIHDRALLSLKVTSFRASPTVAARFSPDLPRACSTAGSARASRRTSSQC